MTTYRTVTVDEARKMMAHNDGILLIDVRTPEEFDGLHIAGALNIPLFELLENIGHHATDPNHTIILYCQTGKSSLCAAQALVYIGYRNVYNLGGIADSSDSF